MINNALKAFVIQIFRDVTCIKVRFYENYTSVLMQIYLTLQR